MKTLVLGASVNQNRASFEAVLRLKMKGHEVIALGIREGNIYGIPVLTGMPLLTEVDTITLYLNADRQREYYDYMLEMLPRRIIFNPGTENPELIRKAKAAGIETEIACTLVMLSLNSY